MGDEETTQPPRESTARRVIGMAGNDALHKGINWTTLAGVIATAALGYLSDQRSHNTAESIASGAAEQIAAVEEWRGIADRQLAYQAEQIARLREAVAALRAANETLLAGRRADAGPALRAAADLLDPEGPPSELAPPVPGVRAEDIRRKLLGGDSP